MSKEQINLSEALDIIAQSKADIKSSVQGKGSEIGDDLTEYNTAIENIKFRSMSFNQNSFTIGRYNDIAWIEVQEYIDGVKSYPDNISYTVSGSYVNVVEQTAESNRQRFTATPTNYGNSILYIKDDMGNVEYPITLNVPQITINYDGDTTNFSGFSNFFWDENIPVASGDHLTGWDAVWDDSQDPYYFQFVLDDGNGHGVPASAVHCEFGGSLVDEGYVTVTSSTVQGYNNIIRIIVTPVGGTLYNGEIMINITDGTSESSYFSVFLTGGEDIPESQPSFTYDGSNQNDPIQVNVDLTNYPGGEIVEGAGPEVNINFVAPSSDYNWNNDRTWGDYQELDSNNNNDCTLLNQAMFDGTWRLGDIAWGYTGPRTAGTYLRSYSVTFTYDESYSTEEGGSSVAQALDGTPITFWVQYNVTGSIPQPE